MSMSRPKSIPQSLSKSTFYHKTTIYISMFKYTTKTSSNIDIFLVPKLNRPSTKQNNFIYR